MKPSIDVLSYHNRRADPMPTLYQCHIGTPEGRWLATLKGRSLEHLQDRAARFCVGVGRVRVITDEEMDAFARLNREGFIPIGRRHAA